VELTDRKEQTTDVPHQEKYSDEQFLSLLENILITQSPFGQVRESISV